MINGNKESIPEDLSIGSLLQLRKIAPETVVVEHNMNIIPRNEWNQIPLQENDTIEVLRFVGGGSR